MSSYHCGEHSNSADIISRQQAQIATQSALISTQQATIASLRAELAGRGRPRSRSHSRERSRSNSRERCGLIRDVVNVPIGEHLQGIAQSMTLTTVYYPNVTVDVPSVTLPGRQVVVPLDEINDHNHHPCPHPGPYY